jgi:hypothetical protein
MTKKNKSIIVVVAILVVLGVVMGCARIQIGNKEDELYSKLNEFKSQLPSDVTVENNMIKGMFTTRGDYNISKGENSIKIHYKVEHGFLSWLWGPMEFKSKTSINIPNLKMMEPIKTEGKVSQDGSLDLVSNSVDIVYVLGENAQVTISPTTSHLVYNGKTGQSNSDLTIPTINVETSDNVLKINNIKGTKNTNDNQPLLGTFNVAIDSISDNRKNVGMLTVGKINLNVESKNVNNKYNTKFDITANDLETPDNKNQKTELAYSVLGLDYNALTDIAKFQANHSLLEDPQNKKKLISDINQIVQGGFSIVIDKFYAQKADGKINLSANYVLSPSNTINFENNSQLNLNVDSEGSWVAPMAENLSTLLGAPITTNGNNLNVKLNYNKGNFTANGLPMDSPLREQIHANLQKLDIFYKIMFDEQNGLFLKYYNPASNEIQAPNALEQQNQPNDESSEQSTQPDSASNPTPADTGNNNNNSNSEQSQ